MTIRRNSTITIPRGPSINTSLCLRQLWRIAPRFVWYFISAVGVILKVTAKALHLPEVLFRAAEEEAAKKFVQKSLKQAASDGRDLQRRL